MSEYLNPSAASHRVTELVDRFRTIGETAMHDLPLYNADLEVEAVEGDYRFAAEPVGPAAGCVVCHSIEKGGPLHVALNLWGIVGDKKARFPWYGYSRVLAEAGGNWSRKDLDAYLTDPDAFLPGTSKTLIGISDPDERADLIAFLATLRD